MALKSTTLPCLVGAANGKESSPVTTDSTHSPYALPVTPFK